jgi:heme a synthase
MEVRRRYRRLVLVTALLTFVVVVVGAYVRLADAGLGCPDWPGCYGQVSPAHAREAIAQAVAAQGGEHGPVSMRKAWKEMVHRYLAGALGFMILAITVVAWRRRAALAQSPLLATGLLGLVIFQAALGAWTVTMLLKPVIVTLHLLGGMATLALVVWLALRQWPRAAPPEPARAGRLRPWVVLGIGVVVAQIALGGWVSSNYAALACIDFPTCHGQWVPEMDFRHGFQFVRPLGMTAAGVHLAYEALTAIHWTHRVGALVTVLYVGALAVLLWRARGFGAYALALAAILAIQTGLGIANVLAGLPLALAAAHNAGAAILLVSLVMINFALHSKPLR